MKKTLYLHIGNHKTGTSSIQRAMCARKKELNQEGITYFSRFRGRAERKSINRWVHCQGGGGELRASIRDGLVQRLARAGDRVVASAESFSWIFSAAEISDFYTALARHFDEIKILAYIRRQDKQIISHHQQGAKGPRTDAARFYGNDCVAIPEYQPHFDLYLDYATRLGKWADAFGDENMQIRVYERSELYRGDAVADFFRMIGSDAQPPEIFVNESNGLLKTKMGHLLNQVLGGESEALRQYLLSQLEDSLPKMQPARGDAAEFCSRYEDSNIRLNERFGISPNPKIFDDDFLMYPQEGQEKWTEESASLAIGELLRAFSKLPVSERQFAKFTKK